MSVATINFLKTMEKKQKKKQKKQIGIYHTREGIGRGRQPAWQDEGEQWRGGGRG
jgi:hypothetical protein